MNDRDLELAREVAHLGALNLTKRYPNKDERDAYIQGVLWAVSGLQLAAGELFEMSLEDAVSSMLAGAIALAEAVENGNKN